MSLKTYSYSTTLYVTSCGSCAIPFALPDDFAAKRQADGLNFYCPNGHGIAWSETEVMKLRRQLKYARDEQARLAAARDQAEASRRAWKGQATKLRNRALEGECPFCGQHLRDLARHIGRLHKDEAAANPETEPVP